MYGKSTIVSCKDRLRYSRERATQGYFIVSTYEVSIVSSCPAVQLSCSVRRVPRSARPRRAAHLRRTSHLWSGSWFAVVDSVSSVDSMSSTFITRIYLNGFFLIVWTITKQRVVSKYASVGHNRGIFPDPRHIFQPRSRAKHIFQARSRALHIRILSIIIDIFYYTRETLSRWIWKDTKRATIVTENKPGLDR